MKNKLYVGNLPWTATNDELSELFSAYGEVVEANIIFDRETNRSKGFGFVTMATEEAAAEAMEKLEGSEFGGRTIRVSEARERRDDA
ncbi:MAG: RNA recognition motif domain-containing protein [Candidatus Dojkabacteria bacterium]